MPKLEKIIASKNAAELLDEQQLAEIGAQVIRGYEIDEESRSEWLETAEKALAIAKQKRESKNHPWPGASNIKFPLITKAAIDYAARTLPQIIQHDKIVKAYVMGEDPQGEKERRGNRVSNYMSYQLLQENDDWEDGMDKLLQILPVLGTVFKKTYYDLLEGRPVSELCIPDKICVNYAVQSLERARRITHILEFFENDIVERIRGGLYRDISLDRLINNEELDIDAPIEILEQHCYLDLDEDGYKEPYIVTVHADSGEVLRIVHRVKSIEREGKKIQRIVPFHYFTDYHFIRSPDGGFYSMGFGTLLLPLNSAINTLINQLVDSGTLNNVQGGFIGRGLRLKNGEFRYKMGEWKVLDAASGTDLQKNIFPMPTKEPSQTLFNLLGALIEVGKDLTANTDMLSGKQAAQNVSQGTVAALIEQGVKIFTAINKRLYRSLKKEYEKLFEINSQFLKDKDYRRALDDPNAKVSIDFNSDDLDIMPVADPNMSSAGQKLVKSQAILNTPGVDPYAAAMYQLESLQLSQSEIGRLLPPPNPNGPPPPEVVKIMAETERLKAETAKIASEARLKEQMIILDSMEKQQALKESESRVNESSARIMKMKQDALHSGMKVQMASGKMQHQATMSELDFEHKQEKDRADQVIKASEVRGKLDVERAKVEASKSNDKDNK